MIKLRHLLVLGLLALIGLGWVMGAGSPAAAQSGALAARPAGAQIASPVRPGHAAQPGAAAAGPAAPRATPPACGGWSQLANAPELIVNPAVVQVGGVAYMFGGVNTGSSAATPHAYKWNGVSWTALQDMPAGRENMGIATDGTYIYLITGDDNAGGSSISFWRYNLTTNTYTTLANFPNNYGSVSAAYLNGKIYAIGGYISGVTTAQNFVYDVATNGWAWGNGLPNYPRAVYHLNLAAYNGKLYAAGGTTDGNSQKTYAYTPGTTAWDDAAIADLPAPRIGAAADFLQGQWVLAGGAVNGVASSSVIAWDAVNNIWQDVSSLPAPREGAGGVKIPGLFLVIGGYDGQGGPFSNTVYQLLPGSNCPTLTPTITPTPTITDTPVSTALPTSTPSACGVGSGRWTAAPAPPVLNVHDSSIIALNGSVYQFGGQVATDRPLTNAYRYNPASGVWSAIAPLPAPRMAQGIVTDGTSIYLLGGFDNNQTQATLWRYNPATNTYTTLTAPSLGIEFTGLAYLNGRIYRISGTQNNSSATATVDIYTISTNSWAAGPAYPLAVFAPVAMAYNGYIYAAGGYDDGTLQDSTVKTYRLDPTTGTWNDAAIADLPLAIAYGAADLLDGQWIVTGGLPAGNYPYDDMVLAWNPSTNGWRTLPHLSNSRFEHGAAAAGNTLYAIGGYMNLTTPVAEQYTIVPCGGAGTPTATATVTRMALPTQTPGGPTATDTPTATVTRPALPTQTPGGPTATDTPGAMATPIPFTDVQSTDYFYTAVQYLAARGIVSGYSDGTFRPYNPTTRGQLAKIVALGFALPAYTPPGGATFSDVPTGSTFYAQIEAAAHIGAVAGYACGATPAEPCDSAHRPYYRPAALVTRGQLAKIITLAARWPLITPATATFSDVPTGSTFYAYVQTAVCHAIVSGYSDGTFRPTANATRGQISKIVYGAITGTGTCTGAR